MIRKHIISRFKNESKNLKMHINFSLIIKQEKLLHKNDEVKYLRFYLILLNLKQFYNMQYYDYHEINFKKLKKRYNQSYLLIFKLQLVFFNAI